MTPAQSARRLVLLGTVAAGSAVAFWVATTQTLLGQQVADLVLYGRASAPGDVLGAATETLATFLSVVCLYCLTRFDGRRDWWTAGLAGGSIALASLCRPTFLPWLPLVMLVALWQPASWPRR